MDVDRSTAAALADLHWLRGLAAVVAADQDDADDLVQETLVAAWSRPPADGESSVRPWLGAVLRNRFRMMVRGRARRAERERVAEPMPASPDEPEPALARLEILRVLISELEALPSDDRDLLVRRFFDGQSAADIARALGVPDATVRSKIHRALQRLRVALDRRFRDRRAWCAALGLPPMVGGGPITEGGGMSIAMKGLLIAGVVTTVGGAAWVATPKREATREVVTTLEAPMPTPTDASPRRAWEQRRERIHRALAEAPPAPPDAVAREPEVDLEASERHHRIVREQLEECLVDLESEVNGSITIDVIEIGAPDVGVIYESIAPVTETLRDPELTECFLEGMYAFVGDAPAEPYRRSSTWTLQIGDSDQAGVAEQRMFDSIVGAHIGEIRFCEKKLDESFAGSWRVRATIGEGGIVTDASADESPVNDAFVECAVKAVRRWQFPDRLAGRTHAYTFVLPMPARPEE